MRKPKILAISYYFPPLSTPRSIRLALLVNYMAQKGLADWTVIAAHTPFPTLPKDPELLQLLSPEVKIYKALSLENRWINYLSRKISFLGALTIPDEAATWVPFACDLIRRKIKVNNFDLLVSFSSPATSHVLAWEIYKYAKIPWMAYFSDPLVNSLWQLHPRKEKILRQIEQSVYTHASYLMFTNQHQMNLCLGENEQWLKKSAVIPHAVDRSLYKKNHERLPWKPGKFRILYAGSFYGRRSPEILLDALKILRERNPDCYRSLQVLFLGKQPYSLRRQINCSSVSDIVDLVPPVSYLASLAYMRSADLLLVLDAADQISPFLPSKLVDYLGADRPILGITPPSGPTFQVLRGAGQPVVSTFSSQDIASAIYKMWLNHQNHPLNGKIIPEDVLREFLIESVAEKFLSLMDG